LNFATKTTHATNEWVIVVSPFVLHQMIVNAKQQIASKTNHFRAVRTKNRMQQFETKLTTFPNIFGSKQMC